MTMTERVVQLRRARTPFVHATVVRAQPPASARPGDEAILLADGTIEGFVGGQCAQNSVRKAALGALEAGESLLLRVLPDGEVDFPQAPGARVVVNPCPSGGALRSSWCPRRPPRWFASTARRRLPRHSRSCARRSATTRPAEPTPIPTRWQRAARW